MSSPVICPIPDDPINGVCLPANKNSAQDTTAANHKELHGTRYQDDVTRRIFDAYGSDNPGDCDAVIRTIRDIAESPVDGSWELL